MHAHCTGNLKTEQEPAHGDTAQTKPVSVLYHDLQVAATRLTVSSCCTVCCCPDSGDSLLKRQAVCLICCHPVRATCELPLLLPGVLGGLNSFTRCFMR
jgi:hypothetical protein